MPTTQDTQLHESWYKTNLDGKKVITNRKTLRCFIALTDLFSDVSLPNSRTEFSAERFEEVFGNPTLVVNLNIAHQTMKVELRDDHDKIAHINISSTRVRKIKPESVGIGSPALCFEEDEKEYPPRIDALIGIKAGHGDDQDVNIAGASAKSIEAIFPLRDSLKKEIAEEIVLPWGEIDHLPSDDFPWGNVDPTSHHTNAVRGKVVFSDVLSERIQNLPVELFKEFIGEYMLHIAVSCSGIPLFYELRFENEHGQVAGLYGQRTMSNHQVLEIALGMKAKQDEEESSVLPGTSKETTRVRAKMTSTSPDDVLGTASIEVPEG